MTRNSGSLSQSTRLQGGVDELFIFVLWVTVISLVLVLGAMVWFAIRYKAGSGGPRGSMPTHNMALEVTWTLIPTTILGVIFFWGTRDYAKMSVPSVTRWRFGSWVRSGSGTSTTQSTASGCKLRLSSTRRTRLRQARRSRRSCRHLGQAHRLVHGCPPQRLHPRLPPEEGRRSQSLHDDDLHRDGARRLRLLLHRVLRNEALEHDHQGHGLEPD